MTKNAKSGKKRIVMIILGILLVILVITTIQFIQAEKKSLKRFLPYQEKSKVALTSYGRLTYIDEGQGDVILSCHGICGGYDQAYDTVSDKTEQFRILAPSRFGYPGSDVPENPSIDNQVEAFVELLDQLHIDKTYLLATSAGGAVAIRFSIMHPERTQGLILYCSGYPALKKPEKEMNYIGPPSFLAHDLPMWLGSPLFGPIMGMDRDTIEMIMPLENRHDGIVLDAEISNTVMENHYEDYDMSKLQVPVLILHAKDDKLADYTRAAAWAEKIPDCKAVFFETGGHLMVGNSDKINSSFTEFVQRTAE